MTVLARQSVEDALEEEMRTLTDDIVIEPMEKPAANPQEVPLEEKETESPASQERDSSERPRSFLI